MKRQINKNFRQLVKTYISNKDTNFKACRLAMLEGSSRSGKTISSIDFIIWYCLYNTGKTVFLIRNTYNSHKTTLYIDFHKRLKDFNLPSPFDNAKEVSQFSINGNNVFFIGADTPAKFEGAGCDLAYFNEILDIQQVVFDQVEQRCREMVFGDYNPKFTMHWVYQSILKRDDVDYMHSVFSDNPFISSMEKKKILSYEPTKYNIEKGTVNEYRWKVYGLGERAAQEGLVFKHVTWVQDMPKVDNYTYGLDFGFTNDPSCLVRGCIIGNDLYLQKLLYEPIDNSLLMSDFFTKIGLDGNDIIVADSSDIGGTTKLGFVSDLNEYGFTVIKAKKGKGSIEEGIAKLLKYKIHLVLDADVKTEQENYCYKEINSMATNQPIDKFNHFWDAARYLVQAYQEPMAIG